MFLNLEIIGLAKKKPWSLGGCRDFDLPKLALKATNLNVVALRESRDGWMEGRKKKKKSQEEKN